MDLDPITNHDATDIPISNPITPFTTGEAFRMRAMMSRRSPPPACSNSGSVDMRSRGSLSELRVVAGRLRSRSDAPADNAHRAPATNTRRTSPWTHRGGSGWPGRGRLVRFSLVTGPMGRHADARRFEIREMVRNHARVLDCGVMRFDHGGRT